MKKTIITLIATLSCSATALADNKLLISQFSLLDKDSDGFLTLAEIQAKPHVIRHTNFFYQGSFKSADINRDNLISQDEYIANEQDTY